MNYVFVGSANPVKVNSVKAAVISHWPKAEVIGFEVASGVSSQPMSDQETKRGATHRAQRALQAGLADLAKKKISLKPETVVLGVGLEGGVTDTDGEMWSTVWVVVADNQGETYASNGARFLVPEIVARKIRAGDEMGVATATITGIENIKHKGGLIGIITDDFTNRTEEYGAIVKMALGIWYGRNWQKKL
ncbi:DUF84 family protein [soil metagenome]